MIGAIIGDIVGSRFEFNNHKSKDFEMFTDECEVTDDSIMTLAVAKALMEADKKREQNKEDPTRVHEQDREYYYLVETMVVRYMQGIGRRYPNCGYGGRFFDWLFSSDPHAYNSYGNGAAMRISSVAFTARTEVGAIKLSQAVTGVTHNHPEGLLGAEATTVAIFMARQGSTKEEIRNRIISDYYPLNFTIDGIRDSYKFDVSCQGTVPQAIQAFLESDSFEDAIRTAISVGGDSDTLAAITGAIAEAHYGVPEEIKEKALTYLDGDLVTICEEWTEFTKTA